MSCSRTPPAIAGLLFIYGAPDLAGILGNDAQIYDYQCGEHVIRFQGAYRTYIAHNTLNAVGTVDNITIRGASSLVVVYDNDLLNGYSNVQPQNAVMEEYQHHVVFDGNRIRPDASGQGIGPYDTSIGVAGSHVALRNNLAVNTPQFFIAISGHPLVFPPHGVSVVNNSVFCDTRAKNYGRLGTVQGASGVTIVNNLIYNLNPTPFAIWTAILTVGGNIPGFSEHRNLYYGTLVNPAPG